MEAIFQRWLEKEQSRLQGIGAKKGKRKYLHFDNRISKLNDEELAIFLDPNRIAKHSFFPFIRIYKKVWLHKEEGGKKRVLLKKNRPIDYASHKDSLVYSWYGFKLQNALEEEITKRNLSENVIAYRALDKKTNVHFAHEVFSFFSEKGDWIALTFDIEKFFESIDHGVLRIKWASILRTTDLPPDHKTVYRGMTRFSYVRKGHAYEILNIKEQGRGMRRISTSRNFRRKIVDGKAVTRNSGNKGIPQGAAISCVLSNLYMLDLDTEMKKVVDNFGGMYRRYSDDIAIICPAMEEVNVVATITGEIRKLNLNIQPEKSERFCIQERGGKSIVVDLNKLGKASRFRYLGIEFDGQESYLRHAGIARFQRRRAKSIRRLEGEAKRKHKGILPRKQLYERFLERRGNYLAYGLRVNGIFRSKTIKHQISRSRFSKQMRQLVNKAKQRLALEKE